MTDICTRCEHTIGYDCNCTEIERLTAERDRYKAQVERAEEALREIAKTNDPFGNWKGACRHRQTTARVALAQIYAEPADDLDDEAYTAVYLKGLADGKDETRKPTVKPLEWRESPDDDTDFCAEALGLVYVVDCDLDGLCSWGFFRHVGREGYDDDWTIEDAKAAAQADYERRILSALAEGDSQ